MNRRDSEIKLLELFRKLDDDDKEEALDYLSWLVESVDDRKNVDNHFEDIIPRN